MNVIEQLKKFLFDTSNEGSTHESYHMAQDAKSLNLPPLSDYETRQKKLSRVQNPLTVFFIYIMAWLFLTTILNACFQIWKTGAGTKCIIHIFILNI